MANVYKKWKIWKNGKYFTNLLNEICRNKKRRCFPKIFGNKNRNEVLIPFLNAVLLLQENHEIVNTDIWTPYQLHKCQQQGLPKLGHKY
jgi:hypothetical protein